MLLSSYFDFATHISHDERKAVKIHKGTATPASETTINEGKVYYAKVGNGYVQVSYTDEEKPTINPKTKGWFTIA